MRCFHLIQQVEIKLHCTPRVKKKYLSKSIQYEMKQLKEAEVLKELTRQTQCRSQKLHHTVFYPTPLLITLCLIIILDII